MKILKMFVLALCIIGIYGPASAEWKTSSRVDSMTDEKRLTAIGVNSAGYRIQIYRIKNKGPVWINFEIPESSVDMFAPSKPLMYRVDKNQPSTVNLTNPLASIGFVNSEWNPKWINFLVWHGNEKEGFSPILSQFMRGKQVVFRYALATGGFKDVEFDLAGADVAISQALNVSIEVSAEQLEGERNVRIAASSYIKACVQKQNGNAECIKKISNCIEGNKSNVATFKACADSD